MRPIATTSREALAGLSDSQLVRRRAGGAEAGQRRLPDPLAEHHPTAAARFAQRARDPRCDLSQFVEPHRTRRRERYAGRHRAPGAASRAAGEAARLCESCGVEARRSDGEDARRGPAIHGRLGADRQGESGQRSGGHSGGDRRAESRVRPAALGLGLLRGSGAQGEIRPR